VKIALAGALEIARGGEADQDSYHGTVLATVTLKGGTIMAPAFPFPPSPPPRRPLNWSSWAVIAGTVFLLVVIAVMAMYFLQLM
jgi:hypothetical protein